MTSGAPSSANNDATSQRRPSASATPFGDVSPMTADADAGGAALDTRAHAELSLLVAKNEVLRSAPFVVTGTVKVGDSACAYTRVDITLVGSNGQRFFVGALPTDANGRFNGKLTISPSIDVGDYSVIASTPGGGICGASR